MSLRAPKLQARTEKKLNKESKKITWIRMIGTKVVVSVPIDGNHLFQTQWMIDVTYAHFGNWIVLNISTECIDRAYITRTYVHATHFSLVFPPFSHAGWADDAAIMTGGRPSIVNQTYLLCKAHTAFWQKFIQIQSPTHSPCCSPSGTPLPLPSQGPSMLSLPMNACIYACMKNT